MSQARGTLLGTRRAPIAVVFPRHNAIAQGLKTNCSRNGGQGKLWPKVTRSTPLRLERNIISLIYVSSGDTPALTLGPGKKLNAAATLDSMLTRLHAQGRDMEKRGCTTTAAMLEQACTLRGTTAQGLGLALLGVGVTNKGL